MGSIDVIGIAIAAWLDRMTNAVRNAAPSRLQSAAPLQVLRTPFNLGFVSACAGRYINMCLSHPSRHPTPERQLPLHLWAITDIVVERRLYPAQHSPGARTDAPDSTNDPPMAALYNHNYPLPTAFPPAPAMTWPAAYQYEVEPLQQQQSAILDHPRYIQQSRKHRQDVHSKPKRKRRRKEEIERMYRCGWQGCTKAYGTLNHLNIHARLMGHGPKRLPTEFTEIRRRWRLGKQQEESATFSDSRHQQPHSEFLGNSYESMLAHPPSTEHQMRYLSVSTESYTSQGSPDGGVARGKYASGAPNAPFPYSVYPVGGNESPFWEVPPVSDMLFGNSSAPGDHPPFFGAYPTDTRAGGSNPFPFQTQASTHPNYWDAPHGDTTHGNTANGLTQSPPTDEGSDVEWRP